MTVNEVQTLLKASIPNRERAYFRAIYETFYRANELLMCDIEDYNKQMGELIARHTKNKYNPKTKQYIKSQPKHMVLSESTQMLFKHIIGNRKKGPIFINKNGKRLTKTHFQQVINDIAMMIGIQKITHITPTGKQYNLVTLKALREAGSELPSISDLSLYLKIKSEKSKGSKLEDSDLRCIKNEYNGKNNEIDDNKILYLQYHEIIALKSLLEIYIEKNQYEEAFNVCEQLKNRNIYDQEKYCKKAYSLYEKYQKDKKKSITKKHIDNIITEEPAEIKYLLQNYAISDDLRKKINYVFYNLRERKKPDSILLYGPPGCGKTELARSIAGELNFDIFELDSSVLSEYIGVAEKNIRKLFDDAREQGNCVIIIDEFEAFAYKRENRVRSWEFSQTAEMLKQIENTLRYNKAILVIATTNYYEMIDTAMIRKGRFNNHIQLSEPDQELRKKIFEIKLRNLIDYNLEKNLDYNNFAVITEGLTGADIDDIVCNVIPHILYQKKKKTITNDIVKSAIKQNKNEIQNKNDQTRYYQ